MYEGRILPPLPFLSTTQLTRDTSLRCSDLPNHDYQQRMRRPPGWVNNPKPGVFYPTGSVPRTPLPLLDSVDVPEGLQSLATASEIGHDDHDHDRDDTDESDDETKGRGGQGQRRGQRASRLDRAMNKLAEPKQHLKVRVSSTTRTHTRMRCARAYDTQRHTRA